MKEQCRIYFPITWYKDQVLEWMTQHGFHFLHYNHFMSDNLGYIVIVWDNDPAVIKL